MPARQLRLSLGDNTPPNVAGLVENNHLHVKQSTFLGGLAESVHRWFRLTPSFGPELVRNALVEMETEPGSVVLDPFAGAGTTLIEAKLEGHAAVGFEINPLLHFVCETSVEWDLAGSALRRDLERIGNHVRHRSGDAGKHSLAALDLLAPPIHNVFRWWREDVLVDLLLVLEGIREVTGSPKHRRFFELGLAGILVPNLTNVTLGRLQLHFIKREDDEIRVWETFHGHALKMIDDIEKMSKVQGTGSARAIHTDATLASRIDGIPRVDRVITSPPYPNRYSYVWNTRPHLYLLGFFHGPAEASALDKETIGGTWGTATSILTKGTVRPTVQAVGDVVGSVVAEIREQDLLMSNYAMKYFNQLATQIAEQDRLLARGARLAYVVGCSRLKGVYVETDVLLGQLFEALRLGYKVLKIERFRRRHSGKDLHEATVYVQKD